MSKKEEEFRILEHITEDKGKEIDEHVKALAEILKNMGSTPKKDDE